MVEPIDVGIWKLCMQSSEPVPNATYCCEKCSTIIVCIGHKKLPKKCPCCGHEE